jgi:hypothetical protein
MRIRDNLYLIAIDPDQWDGGHYGQRLKHLYLDFENPNEPFQFMSGWGHGLGGCNANLETIKEYGLQDDFSSPVFSWFWKILSDNKDLSIQELSQLVFTQYESIKKSIPNKYQTWFQ